MYVCCVHFRFPGDICEAGNTAECMQMARNGEFDVQKNYDARRYSWHIDGVPNDNVPGVSDYYGSLLHFAWYWIVFS